MVSFTSILVLTYASTALAWTPWSLFPRAACNANNCLRAVTGSGGGKNPAQARADCVSFLLRTVTPAPVIVTPTITVSTTSTQTNLFFTPDTTSTTTTTTTTIPYSQPTITLTFKKRTITATSIPVTASACANVAAYSSACSCFGVTGSITTLPAVTLTFVDGITVTDLSATTTLRTITSNTKTVYFTSVITETEPSPPPQTTTTIP